MDCLFCRILKGEIPSKKVYEDEKVYAFADIHPVAKHHVLFVHRNHSSHIIEMNDRDVSEVFQSIKNYIKGSSLLPDGFRIVTNVGPHGGQTVFHTHFHVIGGERLGRMA